MKCWALRMPTGAAPAVGPLRLLPGVEAALVADDLWLRGAKLRDDDERQLREIPGAERFAIGDDAELIPPGARVPIGWLPEAQWLPLPEFARLELALAPLQHSPPRQQPLVLAGDDVERPIAAILTSIDALSEYADSAPLVRLLRLKFLASSDGRVLIVGAPLPPLAGERFWESEGIFVAAGYRWQPAIDALLVRRALGLAENELAMWRADGTWERASREDLVLARRDAVRATREGLQDGT
jgi:MoxR-vWA-beta-propeller ternary system protein